MGVLEAVGKNRHTHWRTRELLARYVELELNGYDAAAIYPDVALHLRQCEICRNALADMLSTLGDEDHAISPGQAPVQDLSFLGKGIHRYHHTVRPSSTCSSFGIYISLPLASIRMAQTNAPNLATRSARELATQLRKQLLLYDTIQLGEDAIQIMLTLCGGASPGSHSVIGELSSKIPLSSVKACLHAGARTYFSIVQGDRLYFDDVIFDENVDRVIFALETVE